MVTGTVAGAKVRFTWQVPGGTQPGDTFVWRERPGGRQQRTAKTSLALPHHGQRCLQVTLLRGDAATATESAPSSPACVG